MANKTQTVSDLPGGHPPDPKHHGPTPAQYVRIGIMLAIITLIEIAASFMVQFGLPYGVQIATLLIFALVKGAAVAMFFMHLRFDSRWFQFLFVTGMILAVFCVLAMMALFSYRSGLVA